MKWKRQPKDFVRPMLNSPVQGSMVEADFFIGRLVTRLNGSRAANEIVSDYIYNQPSPVPPNDPAFLARSRSMAIWGSL
jgi:hypothetical protein